MGFWLEGMFVGDLGGVRVDIREARASDAVQVITFVRGVADEPDNTVATEPGEFNLSVEEEERILEEVAASENSIFLLAVADGEIVGVLTCWGGKRRANRHSTSLGMSVLKEKRGQGIGTIMMERAIEWAKGTGVVTRIELEVFPHNRRAIHIYEKCGFVTEGVKRRAYVKSGRYVDAVMMAFLLEDSFKHSTEGE